MDIRDITIKGRLGANAEVKGYGNENKTLMSLAVATTCGFGDKQVKLWFKCTSFRYNDQKIAQYLVKGATVLVRGELGQESWTDQQSGAQKTALTINVDKIVLLDSQQSNSEQPPAPPPAQPPQYRNPAQQPGPGTPPLFQGQQQPSQGGWGGQPPATPQGGWGAPTGDDDIPF